MKIFCGTDIIEIERIKKSIQKSGETFLNLIYTPAEIAFCESKRNAKYMHYAGRFAAKEAIFKAVSEILKNKYDISWHNAQIIDDENGKPKIEFLDIKLQNLQSIEISISHCKEYAIATAIAIVDI